MTLVLGNEKVENFTRFDEQFATREFEIRNKYEPKALDLSVVGNGLEQTQLLWRHPFVITLAATIGASSKPWACQSSARGTRARLIHTQFSTSPDC